MALMNSHPMRKLAIGLVLAASPLAVLYAAPQGGSIVGGTGSISTNGLSTNITQTTQSMAIDWQSYDVGRNEIVNYLQPNSSSIALNRILGGLASQML
jgi:hypothetical protein